MPFLSFLRPKTDDKAPLLERCLSVDLEVDPKKAEIFDLAAVRFGPGAAVVAGKGRLQQSLDKLEAALKTTSYIIGHNILRHDIEHLLAARPRLRDKMMAPIDTLWLNPLAFPRNPYHHLVKHHHDGRLHAGHVNDPELDARLVFDVLSNQIEALKGQSPAICFWRGITLSRARIAPTDLMQSFSTSATRARRTMPQLWLRSAIYWRVRLAVSRSVLRSMRSMMRGWLGRWPMPWRGSLSRAGNLSCLLGSGPLFLRWR